MRLTTSSQNEGSKTVFQLQCTVERSSNATEALCIVFFRCIIPLTRASFFRQQISASEEIQGDGRRSSYRGVSFNGNHGPTTPGISDCGEGEQKTARMSKDPQKIGRPTEPVTAPNRYLPTSASGGGGLKSDQPNGAQGQEAQTCAEETPVLADKLPHVPV
jgi:hypothetical protein